MHDDQETGMFYLLNFADALVAVVPDVDGAGRVNRDTDRTIERGLVPAPSAKPPTPEPARVLTTPAAVTSVIGLDDEPQSVEGAILQLLSEDETLFFRECIDPFKQPQRN